MIDPVIERQYADCCQLMSLWRKYHDYFKVAVAGREITPEREHEFITIKSHIAMLHDIFMDCLEHDQNIGQNILSIVTRSITLKHIHRMSTAEIKKIELEWHESYLLLNETIGVLEDKRNQFADVKPSEYYRKLYTRKALKSVKDFLTGWVFKSIVILIVVLVAIFLCIQFNVLDTLAEKRATKTLVIRFENLLRLVLKDYPYRDISPAYFQRLDRTPPARYVNRINETAHTDPKFAPEVGIRTVAQKMRGDPNDVSGDIRNGMDRDTCRTENWEPNPYWGAQGIIVYLYRFKTTEEAKAIEAKFNTWRNQQTNPDWDLFRRANVIGVITGGDELGGLRKLARNQYLHIRDKK